MHSVLIKGVSSFQMSYSDRGHLEKFLRRGSNNKISQNWDSELIWNESLINCLYSKVQMFFQGRGFAPCRRVGYIKEATD